jgi:hypothetical protein
VLAISDLAEHRALAEMCRVRLAAAINLRREASRCIKRGVAPPLPASYPVARRPNTAREWISLWSCSQAWLVAWAIVWDVAWTSDRN